LPDDEAERRGEIERVWKSYLAWRHGHILFDTAGRGEGGSTTAVQRPDPTTFVLLGEIENSARHVFREHYSDGIPLDFIMALMEASAVTTSRFMLANPARATRFERLAFEVLWSGLSAMKAERLKE
jgi:hypothetical protein